MCVEHERGVVVVLCALLIDLMEPVPGGPPPDRDRLSAVQTQDESAHDRPLCFSTPDEGARIETVGKETGPGCNGSQPSPFDVPASVEPERASSTRKGSTGNIPEMHESSDRLPGRKRKRRSSPPWQFPAAVAATLKTGDGRRVSARVNPGTSAQVEHEARARSSSQSAAPQNPRIPSPPWKKCVAEGPTSVVVDGKRKSGRVNRELKETPPKRTCPRSKQDADTLTWERKTTKRGRKKGPGLENSTPRETKDSASRQSRRSTSFQATDDTTKIAELKAQIAALQSPGQSNSAQHATKGRKRKRRQRSSDPSLSGGVSPSSPAKKHRRPVSGPIASGTISKPSPRLKLRFNAAKRVISPPHPNARIPSPLKPPSRSLHQILDHLDLKELQQPYSENERGPPSMSWFIQRAQKQAADEGTIRLRLLEESKSGGKLSAEKSAIYHDWEPQEEPSKQYGHHDHITAHALHLRHLQVREKSHHRALAKKVAHEALEYWKAWKGPTEDEIRAGEDKFFEKVYQQCVCDVKEKWHLVHAHVQAKKLREWEAQEEKLRQARLQQKLQWSENQLARQRTGADSMDRERGGVKDEDEEESSTGDEEENMTESGSDASSSERERDEADEMGDADLTAYLAQRNVGSPRQSTDIATSDGPDPLVSDLLDPHETSDDGQDDEFRLTDDNGDVPEDRQASGTFQDLTDAEYLTRRSQRSSVLPNEITEENELNLSEDDSTDMDSGDSDSVEEASSTDDDDNAGSAENAEQDSKAVRRDHLLWLLRPRVPEIKQQTGLPTPTTSAEGDEQDLEQHVADEGAATNSTRRDHEAFEGNPAVAANPTFSGSGDHEPPANPGDAPDDGTVETRSADPATRHMVAQPSLLRGNLRSYQHAGLDWLASLHRNGTNGILADEMGLGKTIQTIALLAHLAEEHDCWETHLIIVPTSVILNWVNEFHKFLPGFRVLGYYGTAEDRQIKRRGWVNDPHLDDPEKRGYNVIITSYNVAMQDINALRNVQWHHLVLDEAHNIRNFNSQRWQLLIRLKSKGRLLLTGTPLQNSLKELWALLTFLTAGDDDPAHGDLEEFLSNWKEPVNEIFDRGVQTLSGEAQRVVDQLHLSLRPFLLRRLKSEVEKDLPKKTESVVVCKLSKRQRQLYQDYMGLAETRKNLVQGNAGKVLLSLRRVCNHPDLFDPRAIETSWAMERAAFDGFETKEKLVRRLLGDTDNSGSAFRLTAFEGLRKRDMRRARELNCDERLNAEIRTLQAAAKSEGPAGLFTIDGCRALQRARQREKQVEHLQASIKLSEDDFRKLPIYGSDLCELLTLRRDRPYHAWVTLPRRTPGQAQQIKQKTLRGWPPLASRPLRFESEHMGDWLLAKDSLLQKTVRTPEVIAEDHKEIIIKFGFVTPAVTAPVLDYCIAPRVQNALRASPAYPVEVDYAHEARTRLAIAFPDKRLLIYDSGKLQRLTYLLRDLQAKGSRSLIFTQMTGTLNVLEQFLNLLNLPYLRLDGSTPVERRQLHAAEFNRPDSKYQCMILSSRAGGVGLNLTGASSVIFFDLDWNPQMDRQCMDRAHRIGQVRDVEVFKMVSERTVEENILKRANQKSLLDRAVIQEGHFTTEYQPSRAAAGEDVDVAIERVLGGADERSTVQTLESVEDTEDVLAAQQARKEENRTDAADWDSSKRVSEAATPVLDNDDVDGREGHLDLWMVKMMESWVKEAPFSVPAIAKKAADREKKKKKRKR